MHELLADPPVSIWAGPEDGQIDDLTDDHAYYASRASRRIADSLVRWLDLPAGLRWLDVACLSGAVAGAVLTGAGPAEVHAVEPTSKFARHARGQVVRPSARHSPTRGVALPFGDGRFDVVVTGVLEGFVPESSCAVSELVRVASTPGVVAAYLSLPGPDGPLRAGEQRDLLRAMTGLWTNAGLHGVVAEALTVPAPARRGRAGDDASDTGGRLFVVRGIRVAQIRRNGSTE
ncbi:class I SAM-dependent methyltransferase [Pseudonocardia sp. TRM90224]|uniref:class I SAM-dependent methyltransferase n=1 Tax=Pseudonocardia sp. TRM90224 TaxID=2812678 RepID=UPI001E430621|nr:methyltransferase domain-containing protein [Pseudonocardia sp. TRM90224]